MKKNLNSNNNQRNLNRLINEALDDCGMLPYSDSVASHNCGSPVTSDTPGSQKQGVLVAFSGGADSTALLYSMISVCRSRGYLLFAAHVNHMLRGTDADRDEEFCRDFCRQHGITLYVLREDAAKKARDEGKGVEEAARDLRYGYFDRLRREHPEICRIATAHTASDNAETVLFNLSRGSGANGLCGIPPVRGEIIRPLIYATKDDVLLYCRENSLNYVCDATNSDTAYSRNLIRAKVVPLLDGLFPGFAGRTARTASMLRLDCAFLDSEARELYASLVRSDGSLPVSGITALHPAMSARVLMLAHKAALADKGNAPVPEYTHITELIRLLKKGSGFSLSLPGASCRAERGLLTFCPHDAAMFHAPPFFTLVLREGKNILPDGRGVIYLFPASQKETIEKLKKIYKLSIYKTINGDRISGSILARSRLEGDSYRTGGMTRTLKKLFSGAHTPQTERAILPVITDDRGVLWVPGFGVRDDLRQPEGDSENSLFICYVRGRLDGATEEENE